MHILKAEQAATPALIASLHDTTNLGLNLQALYRRRQFYLRHEDEGTLTGLACPLLPALCKQPNGRNR
jgi:hypothetical protein